MRLALRIVAVLIVLVAAADKPAYRSDFKHAEVGKIPADITVLDGPFAVRDVGGNKCLELAGDPIGTFGALFGPGDRVATDVKARIWAAAQGKRFPEFGIGANDAGGWKLILAPARHVLELRRGDDTNVTAAAKWSSGSWTWFRLRIVPGEKPGWRIEGKVWPDGQPEPSRWPIRAEDPEAPPAGHASLWGIDYSEQPIRFDDLTVRPPEGQGKQ